MLGVRFSLLDRAVWQAPTEDLLIGAPRYGRDTIASFTGRPYARTI